MNRIIEKVELSMLKSKGLIDDIFNVQLEYTIAIDSFLPLIQQILEESGADAIELIGITTPFKLTSEISHWLDNKVDVFARSINDTTFKKLKVEFSERKRHKNDKYFRNDMRILCC